MKNLKYLLLVIPFLFIGSVKAESVEYDYSFNSGYFNVENYSEFDTFLNDNDDIITSLYEITLDKYNSEYSSDFPYYLIQIQYQSNNLNFSLIATDSPLYLKPGSSLAGTYFEDGEVLEQLSSRAVILGSSYSYEDTTYILPVVADLHNSPAHYAFQGGYFYEVFFMDSNYDLKIYTDYDNIVIHNYRDTNSDYIINSGDVYPTLYKSGVFTNKQLVEVNLNDYAYLVLSLKDYNQKPFTTMQYVKGEYCVSGAYDYGLSSKEKYDSSVTDICTPYYNDFTPVNHYVLENDLKNHAIYYLKAHDTSKENKIRVDSSVFNIHYITEEEADNPVININGRNYSILPFDELPSNSIKNTEEGFVPGASEEFSFSDIFTAPLEFLKDVWNSIVNVFDLIIEFIYLLPKELQGFLISSFYLSVAVGLAKMIL